MFERETLRLYSANTGWMMLERIVRLGVALVVGIYVVRHLGPERFGLLSYAISFAGLFAALATLGLEGVLVRELVRDAPAQHALLGTALLLRQAGAAAAFAVVIGAALLVSGPGAAAGLPLIALVAAGNFFQAFTVIECHFQARVEARVLVRAQLFQTLASAALRVALIARDAPLEWFAFAVLADSVLLAAALVAVYVRGGGRLAAWRVERGRVGRLFADSWPLMLSSLVIAFYMKIDQVMLEHLLGEAAVGHYAAAVQLVEAWYFVPMVIANSLFPAIIRARESGDAPRYHTRLQQLYALMVWLALALAVPTSLLAGWIIGVLYGAAYAPAAPVLALYIWASVFVFFGVARSKWVVIENQQRYAIVYLLAGALVNVAGNLVLIPRFGITGAAVATLVALACSMLAVPALLNAPQRQQVAMFVRALALPLALARGRAR
jgi:O-antigen/teichoic acid export membrane protein